jgi:hypothetical protein
MMTSSSTSSLAWGVLSCAKAAEPKLNEAMLIVDNMAAFSR